MTINYSAYIEAQTALNIQNQRVKSFERKLEILIKRQAPPDARGQQYDRPAVQNGFAVNELNVLYEIQEATEQLGIARMLRDEAQEHFESIKSIFDKARERMDDASHEITIFMLKCEGKNIQQISDEMMLSYGTVCNIMTTINAKMREIAN